MRGSSEKAQGGEKGRMKRRESRFPAVFVFLYLAVCSVMIVGICSRSSPLYGFNLWDDANSYFTMGKSIFHGKIPYRDLFDQKGILLYFIYGAASLISYRDFTGVFIMECICAAFTAAGIFAVLGLYLKKTTALVLTPISLALIYSSACFYWGGSAEEFNMPFIIWGMYLLLRTFRRGIGSLGVFVCGILAGCVFNIKFTSLGFFIAQAFIVMLCRASAEKKDSGSPWFGTFVLTGVLYLLGMAVATLPFVLYFAVNGALYDWFYVYVYLNVFVYSEKMALSARLYLMAKILFTHLLRDILISVMIASAYVYGAYIFVTGKDAAQRKSYAAMVLALVFSCFFIYIGGVELVYYFYPVTAFSVMGFVLPGRLAEKLVLKARRGMRTPYLSAALTCAAAFAAAFAISGNPAEMKVVGKDHWLYYFRDVIESSGVEDPKLINIYCFDQGLYTVTGLIPECRFYQTQTIHIDDIPLIQKDFIKSGRADFVLTRDAELDYARNEFSLAAEKNGVLGGEDHTYYLFKRNDS